MPAVDRPVLSRLCLAQVAASSNLVLVVPQHKISRLYSTGVETVKDYMCRRQGPTHGVAHYLHRGSNVQSLFPAKSRKESSRDSETEPTKNETKIKSHERLRFYGAALYLKTNQSAPAVHRSLSKRPSH